MSDSGRTLGEGRGESPRCTNCNGTGMVGNAGCAVCGGRIRLIVPPQGGSGTAPPQSEGKGRGLSGHPFLRAKLYEKCPGCKGTRKTCTPMMVDKLKLEGGGTYSGPLKSGAACPICDDGYIETGLTVGQVERFLAQLDKLAAFVRSLASNAVLRTVEQWQGDARSVLTAAKLTLPAGGSEQSADRARDQVRDGDAPEDR